MLYLLNPRVWIALAIAVALIVSHSWVYRHGKKIVMAEWNAAKASANADARKLETLRQSRVDEAARLAATRAAGARADADRARNESRGLRDDLNAVRLHSEKSIAAARNSVATLSDVFEQCSRRYSELAEIADRHAADALTLRMAWPK